MNFVYYIVRIGRARIKRGPPEGGMPRSYKARSLECSSRGAGLKRKLSENRIEEEKKEEAQSLKPALASRLWPSPLLLSKNGPPLFCFFR